MTVLTGMYHNRTQRWPSVGALDIYFIPEGDE